MSSQNLKTKYKDRNNCKVWELSLEDITCRYSKCCFAVNFDRGQYLKSLQCFFIVWLIFAQKMGLCAFLVMFCIAKSYLSNMWDYLQLFPIRWCFCIVIILFVKQMELFAIICNHLMLFIVRIVLVKQLDEIDSIAASLFTASGNAIWHKSFRQL